jgi:H+/Na+-translocating ferredoxin:NAD+ oxidoreductase subunit G
VNAIAASAVKLASLAAAAALLVGIVDGATRSRIAMQRAADAARALAAELGIPALARIALPTPRPERVDACVAGYGGVMDFDVALDRAGRLLGVGIVNQHETRDIADPVVTHGSAFQNALVGRDPRTASFALRVDGGDIDAVTGATITSRALIAEISAISKATPRSSLDCSG